MGTEVMAIGASKNNQPIKSGLVAMIGPLIDTIIVCTITGLVILLSSEWIEGTYSGVSLTQKSFSNYLKKINSKKMDPFTAADKISKSVMK